MNKLNAWTHAEQINEADALFETYKDCLEIKHREEVEPYVNAIAFKVFPNGAAVRFNKSILGGIRTGLSFLYLQKINIDVLKFDDYYRTELNTIFLYELKPTENIDNLCAHCFHYLIYDFAEKLIHCQKCDFVKITNV